MAYRGRRRSGSLVLLLALAAGCPDKKPASVNLDELVSRLATAVCRYEVACGLLPDMTTCLATAFQPGDDIAVLEAEIASGKILYDAAKAGACAEWFERYYDSTACTRSALAAVGDEGSDACDGVFAGTLAPGSACITSTQCANGGACQPTDPVCVQQCCPGTCIAAVAPLPAGSDCSVLQPNQSCAEGSYCLSVTSGGPPTCFVPSTIEGSACANFYGCESPLFCDMDAATGAGTCRHAAASGAACSSTAPYTLPCDDLRDTCDPVTNTCVRRTPVGGTCDASRYDCVLTALCVGTTCVAAPDLGQACISGTSPDCLGSLQCSTQTSTCELPPSDGSCL